MENTAEVRLRPFGVSQCQCLAAPNMWPSTREFRTYLLPRGAFEVRREEAAVRFKFQHSLELCHASWWLVQ